MKEASRHKIKTRLWAVRGSYLDGKKNEQAPTLHAEGHYKYGWELNVEAETVIEAIEKCCRIYPGGDIWNVTHKGVINDIPEKEQ